jgi:succinate dehydrogenase (ubiquinone) cytochrome b560 subunit
MAFLFGRGGRLTADSGGFRPGQFPIVAISSITVRVTGMVLTIGTVGISLLALADPTFPSAMMSYIGTSMIGYPAKFAVALPLCYHYVGAVRHTYWDATAKGLTNQEAETTSKLLFASTTLMALGVTML